MLKPLGAWPKEVYDHCAHYIKETRSIIIYGGRNHRLYNVRGRLAFGDVYILNLNYLVWSTVKIINGSSIERYLFNSFVYGKSRIANLDHKLYVFGGLTDTNFAGCNVSRLELIEDDAKVVKTLKDDIKYADLAKEMKRKKEKENMKANFDDILEMVSKRQKAIDTLQTQSFAKSPINPMERLGAPKLSLPGTTSGSQSHTYRGFKALPDAFLDMVNSRSHRQLSPTKKH